MDNLASLLKKLKRCYVILGDSMTQVKVVMSHAQGPDEEQLNIAFQKYE